MTTLSHPSAPRPSTLFYFFLLSLAVHAAVLLWLRGAELSLGDVEPPPLVVKLAQAPAPVPAPATKPEPRPAPPQAKPVEQIVSPSDQENDQPPLGRAFLSDRDNRVEQETIRRGNPDAGAPPQPQPEERVAALPPAAPKPEAKPAPKPEAKPAPKPQAKPAPKPAPAARAKAPSGQRRAAQGPPTDPARGRGETVPERLPGLNELFAPPAEVLAKAGLDPFGETDKRRQADDPRKDLVSAPPPAPGLFGGPRGSFDYLPDVAQGNLTMLNTKADRFAPFVRRVGTRVFQNLLIFQRHNLEPSDIIAANDVVTARVTLDRHGKLKSLKIEDHSGSMAVDQTLIDALRQAAFDDNPPPSAANPDGEYEFIFQAQLIAGVGPGPNGPELRTVESRLRIGLL